MTKMTPEEWAEKYHIQIPVVSAEPEPDPVQPGQPEKTNPNRKENEFMMNLMILRNSLMVNSQACKDRAKRAGKWTWRNIRILTALVCKVQDELLATMPDRRNAYYANYAANGHYELVMNGPKRSERFVLISDRHLAALTEAAMETECIMCMRQGSEIEKCPIRKALMEVAPPTELQDGRWAQCEYRDAASSLIRGQDVTV